MLKLAFKKINETSQSEFEANTGIGSMCSQHQGLEDDPGWSNVTRSVDHQGHNKNVKNYLKVCPDVKTKPLHFNLSKKYRESLSIVFKSFKFFILSMKSMQPM